MFIDLGRGVRGTGSFSSVMEMLGKSKHVSRNG